MKTVLTLIAVLAAGCGGKQASGPTSSSASGGSSLATASSSSSTSTSTSTGTPGAGDPAQIGAMTRFHDTLAPRWHAPKGAKRMTDTCSVVGDLQRNADVLPGTSAPASANAADWTAATKELVTAVRALGGSCKANLTEFEPAFERVHTLFHAVMELGEVKMDHSAGGHTGH